MMSEVYVVKFNLASSALHICISSMSFCVHGYQKHNFVQICTACTSDQDRSAFMM